MAATGQEHGAELAVQPDAGGAWHASFNRAWDLELPPGVAHIALDASADVGALRRVRPDAVVLEPPGTAPLCHEARQWPVEINNATHPEVVLTWMERVAAELGGVDVALFIPKAHQKVLLPQSKPRHGPPVDLPADVDAIANWNAQRRGLAGDAARRMAVARDCAARVERLRAMLARDEHGNVLVDHHHGARARGSNAFMAGACKAVGVIGHVRRPPRELASYMMATGLGDAVAVDGGWGDVEGQVPHVAGGTRTVRWRGYTDERWAEAARVLCRADLEQLAARARPNLPGPTGGVPLLVVAGEPCGLPLADPPAAVPAGVAAVVEAVRRVVAGGAGGPTLSKMPPAGGGGHGKAGKVGNAPVAVEGGGESGNAFTGSSPSTVLYTVCRILPGVPTAAIVEAVGAPERTVRFWLADAVAMGLLARHGAARATRYGLPGLPAEVAGPPPSMPPMQATTGVAEGRVGGPVLEVDDGEKVLSPGDKPFSAFTPTAPRGDVGEHLAGVPPVVFRTDPKNAPPPPTPVLPEPCSREANAPETSTGRGPKRGKRAVNGEADAELTSVKNCQKLTTAAPPPAPTAPTPASAAGIVAPTCNPPPPPTARLTGPRAAVVAELRGQLRAAAWDARVAHMHGQDFEAEAAAIMATGTRGPP
jgi:hypothetical protein